ncbi:MAG: hypothetical protein R2873_10225 [Caldilineaceae bacterium]
MPPAVRGDQLGVARLDPRAARRFEDDVVAAIAADMQDRFIQRVLLAPTLAIRDLYSILRLLTVHRSLRHRSRRRRPNMGA